jgi:hypothetical protein
LNDRASNDCGKRLLDAQDLSLDFVSEFLSVVQLELRFVLWRVTRTNPVNGIHRRAAKKRHNGAPRGRT